MGDPRSNGIEEELRRLAGVLAEASASVARILERLRPVPAAPLEIPPATPPPAALPSPPEAAPPQAGPRPVPTGPAAPVAELEEEIDLARTWLGDLPRRQRTGQIAAWAGRARVLQEAWKTEAVPDSVRVRLRGVFGRLTAITREWDCGWVDALWPEWTTDWRVYIECNRALAAGGAADLGPEEDASYHRDRVRGLLIPSRRVTEMEAEAILLEALEALPDTEDVLRAAFERFGRPIDRRRRPAPPPARETPPERSPRPPVDPRVSAWTRGKRGLVVGGQGAREQHRQALEDALEMESLEWVISERGKAGPFNRLAERLRPGSYDLVLFLTAYTSHHSQAVIRRCRESGIPLVYVKGGYGVSAVAQAILDQAVDPPHPSG